MRYFLIFFAVLFFAHSGMSQSAYVPLSRDYYHMLDRIDISGKNFDEKLHTSFKPYLRSDVVSFVAKDSSNLLSEADRFNRRFLLNDNSDHAGSVKTKKPLFKHFYKEPAQFYAVDSEDFELYLNPVIYFGVGRDANSSSTPYINSRGIELRGKIDDKITFYTFLTENQAVFPKYIQDYTDFQGAVPNEGFWKKTNGTGVDFFTARGYIQFKASRHINVQFGHDKNFIGNGYRSLLLSDFGPSYPFLKLQTRVWKFQYTNLYAQLTADAPFTTGPLGGSLGTAEFPKKYMTLHHLSINIGKNFNLGIFESVIFHRGDSTSSSFDINYLNPIIFYRSVEQQVGSPDNAFLGLDFKWNVGKGISLYGQGVLDELIIGEVTSGSGWWGNKYSFQLGGKWINTFGVPNLDTQVEYNYARPFVYAHESTFTNYTHFRQPIAHPLGANFKELVLIARYQPIPKLFVTGQIVSANYGRDPEGINLGGDIFRSYIDPENEFGNTTGQGIQHKLLYTDLTLSYMLRQNLFLDLKHVYRKLSIEGIDNPTTQFTSFAVRLNITSRDYSF